MADEIDWKRLRQVKRWTEEDGRAVVREWQSSGLGMKAFARAKSFARDRLRYWRCRVDGVATRAEPARPPRMIPVDVVGNLEQSGFEVVVNDVVVRVPATFEESALRRLLAVLGC